MDKKPLFIENALTILYYNITSLIDKGYSETCDVIVKQMHDYNLISFLIEKYSSVEDFDVFKNGPYKDISINNYICEISSYVDGNESRKYAISNNKNGLLLLLGIVFDLRKEL